MKLAISGKGGVGKTTVAAALIRYLLEQDYQVFAVDADPDLSLGSVLGLEDSTVEQLKPIVEMREVIAARTGGDGAYFSLNPAVDDLIQQFCWVDGKLTFLKMGAVKQGGSSCYCRENTVLNALVNSLILHHQEAVVMDMGAGIEHLTRGTAQGVDLMLVVLEPSRVSLHTANVVKGLADDLGIKKVKFIGNKVRNQLEQEFLLSSLPTGDLWGILPLDEGVLQGAMGLPATPSVNWQQAIRSLGQKLQAELAN